MKWVTLGTITIGLVVTERTEDSSGRECGVKDRFVFVFKMTEK